MLNFRQSYGETFKEIGDENPPPNKRLRYIYALIHVISNFCTSYTVMVRRQLTWTVYSLIAVSTERPFIFAWAERVRRTPLISQLDTTSHQELIPIHRLRGRASKYHYQSHLNPSVQSPLLLMTKR